MVISMQTTNLSMERAVKKPFPLYFYGSAKKTVETGRQGLRNSGRLYSKRSQYAVSLLLMCIFEYQDYI